jgi:hypothetical protein
MVLDAMKATLTFRLPDERYEHECALRGTEAVAALAELREWLRSQVKYTERSESEKAVIEEVRARLRAVIEERGLTWEMGQ